MNQNETQTYVGTIDSQELHPCGLTWERWYWPWKSCYNFRVVKIDKVVDGDTIDVTIDLGFDLYKKERVRIAGVDTPEKRTRDLEEKALGNT